MPLAKAFAFKIINQGIAQTKRENASSKGKITK
jgi:hypothetical protein